MSHSKLALFSRDYRNIIPDISNGRNFLRRNGIASIPYMQGLSLPQMVDNIISAIYDIVKDLLN
ncbi:MAG: hypothetical protein GX893_01885 [Firmicutes bacterium]|nr:hypothetical protein [Bacillota bacterium]